MGYADRVNVNEKPVCWGDSDSYDTRDSECNACNFQHTCRSEISRKSASAMGQARIASSYSVPIRNYTPYRPQGAISSSYRPQSGGAEYSTWEPGPVSEEDSALTRFLKDGIAGAARGGFYEFYRFFTVFRLK